MKKAVIAAFLLLALTGMFSGCALGGTKGRQSEKVRLYYGSEDNERIVYEERTLTFEEGEDRQKKVLEELIKGPEKEGLVANIAPETRVYGTIRQNDAIIVDFSREFSRFQGSVAEIVGVGSVVNTLVQFEGIEKVKILVEGEELTGPGGQPRGFMAEFSEGGFATQKVVLYFADKEGTGLTAEVRELVLPEGDQAGMVTKVLENLIAGPESGSLNRTIPPEARVQSVRFSGDTVFVDFSEEMHTRHWGGAAGEALTINSIVNTLTEFDFISKVGITVDGAPLNIEHIILEEPIGRDDIIIVG